MNKSEIRKKLLKARKLNNNKNLVVKFSNIVKILKKEKVKRKIIGIKIKLIIDNFVIKNLFIKYLVSKFAPNQLSEVLPGVKFLPFFLISMSHLQNGQSQ